MQTCGTRDSFFSLCAKTSWILGIPKIPTISSFTRLCFGASKTVLFRTFQKSLRFFKFVQKRFGGFFFRIAFPPSLPKLLDSRDFSRGDGLSEFLHFGFPRSLGLLELFELLEQKTQKARTFTVPLALYQFIRCYCLDNQISSQELIFPITTRAVQKQLKLVCDYLGYTGISTHSFRKFYATEIYKNSHYNIALVQQLLQHSSAAVTQRYIGIQQQEIEQAIEEHLMLEV